MQRPLLASILAAILLAFTPTARATELTGGGTGVVLEPRGGGTGFIALQITKSGATVGSGYVGVALYSQTGGEQCDTYVVCEKPVTPNFTCASGDIPSTVGMSASDIAVAIAAGLSANCPSGIVASASVGTVFITTPTASTNACVFASEMGSSGGFALGLNVGEVGSTSCRARNVCDGVSGNERSTDPSNGGLLFAFPSIFLVPFISARNLLLVGVLVALSGALLLRSRSGARG